MEIISLILGMLGIFVSVRFMGIAIKKAGVAWRSRATREPGQPHYLMYLALVAWGLGIAFLIFKILSGMKAGNVI